jgi:hypothetical protein
VILACRLRPRRTAAAGYRGNYGDADGAFPTIRPRALDPADPHHAAALEAFTRFVSTGIEPVICAASYAEALVRPAEDERTLRAAVDAIASLGIRTSAPDEQPGADRPAEHAADPDPGRSQQFISRGR